jgi:hypothetical protein
MGRASHIQNGFNAGELSALLLGRQDIEAYKGGLFTCLNAIPLVQGAWTRRPGTAFLHQCKSLAHDARLIPFQYSTSQTYILEFGTFGGGYIRFFTEHGILTATGQNITAISKASTGVVTYSGADTYTAGDRVIITGVVGMTQVNNREFRVGTVDTGANTFELRDSGNNAVDTSGYDTYTSGGTASEIIEVATNFASGDLPDIRWTQSDDTLYLFHPEFPPQQLVRNSATSWTLSELTFTDGPYDTANTTATTLTPSAATGAITLTASAVTGINGGAGFASTDVGRLIRILEGSTWGYVEITGWTSTTVVSATVLSTLTNTSAKATWRMGVYSDTTGYPACGTFFEDRLLLAGATGYPQRVDGSKTGLYTNFSPSSAAGTVASDNAISFTLNSDDVNAIKWLVADEKGLLAGTSGGEWQIRASTQGEALTPTNITGKPMTKHGSASVAPVKAGRAILFVQRASRKVRELAYVFEVDGFKAPDMTMLAEHITRPAITEMAFQSQPQAVNWCVRSDGVLLGLTYERDHEVIAWHRHELGGFSDEDQLFVPVVQSIAVVTSPDETRDELYMIVQRYINGQEVRYIEYMSKIWEVEDEQEDAFHLDCGWTTINSPVTDTVTGLWHLEGESVMVYVDGKKCPLETVTNGKVTLGITGSIITLGYAYSSDGETMPSEGGTDDGSKQGKTSRIHRLGLWLVDTLGLRVGPDVDSLTEILTRNWGAEYGSATPLFSGVVRERFEGDYDKLGQVYWRADGPFPATVVAAMPQYNVADDS